MNGDLIGDRLHRFARLSLGVGRVCLCLLFVAACSSKESTAPVDSGAADAPTDGQPGDDAPPEVPIDPCCAAADLEQQNIVSFDTPLGRCDPAIDPTSTQQGNCLYFNYDNDLDPPPSPIPPDWVPVLHSPPNCLTPEAVGKCTLPGGQLAPFGTCATSNIVQGTVPTTHIEGGGRCGTGLSAMHLVAKNLSTCVSGLTQMQGFGATLSMTFNTTPSGFSAAVYDATAWEGISFWIRKGAQPSRGSFVALVRDRYTGPPVPGVLPDNQAYCASSPAYYCGTASMPCVSADGGTYTTPNGTLMPVIPDSARCDPFGNVVPLTSEWRFVKLPFATMKQGGAGKPSPLGRLDTSALLGIVVLFPPGDWDMWLDDVSFYRTVSPGAVGSCIEAGIRDDALVSGDASAASDVSQEAAGDGAVPGNRAYNFDTDVEGWMVTYTSAQPGSATIPPGDVQLSANMTDGQPNPGSLQVDIPYSMAGQYVGVGRTSMMPLNLRDRVLTARVKLVSGLETLDDLTNVPGGVKLYVRSGPDYLYAAGAYNTLTSLGTWSTISFDLAQPAFVDSSNADAGPFDPSDIRELGLQIDTSGLTTTAQPAVVLVDTVTY
jgi:hypothetical protein